MRLARTMAAILIAAFVGTPVLAFAQGGPVSGPSGPRATESTAAPASKGPNQFGLTCLLLFDYGPVVVPAGNGAVKAGGSVSGDASPGGEIFYARRLPVPSGFPEIALELPVAYAPEVGWIPRAEAFDPATGASIGGAPAYAALYFVPRLNVSVPVHSAVAFVIGLGFGVARFSEARSGQPYTTTGWPFYFSLGTEVDLGPRWAFRATAGGYGHGVATERARYMINVGLVRAF